MKVDVPREEVNLYESPLEELEKVFQDSETIENPKQVLKERVAAEIGGTPVHYFISPEAGKSVSKIQESERPLEFPMDDEEVLHKLLKIRSFKEIHASMTKKRTREEIGEKCQQLPVFKDKRFKTINEPNEIKSCIIEPLNLSHIYSTQYQEEKPNSCIPMNSKANNLSQKLGPVAKWPYETLTERLILNDVLLML